MIARKSRGGAEVLGLVIFEGTGGTRGVEEAGNASSGAVTTKDMDTGIWGFSTSTIAGG